MTSKLCNGLFLLLFGASLSSAELQALPDDVAQIFDRSQRQLQAPPRSLLSSESDVQNRYFSGREAVERRVGSTVEDDDEQIDVSVSSQDDLEVRPVNASDSRVVVLREPRSAPHRSQSRRAVRGFEGPRKFGVGFVGAGSYGIFGAEFDFGFSKDWTGGFGIGTGMAYSTWGFHARKYFFEGNLTPFFQAGYAHWHVTRPISQQNEVYPVYLGEQFLQESDGSFRAGKRAHLLYPSLGVIFQSQSGLALSLQVQYLINALNFRGALAGGAGFYFYF